MNVRVVANAKQLKLKLPSYYSVQYYLHHTYFTFGVLVYPRLSVGGRVHSTIQTIVPGMSTGKLLHWLLWHPTDYIASHAHTLYLHNYV